MCALALMYADQGQYILKVRILVLVTISLSLYILCSYGIYQIGLLISLLDLSLLLDTWCLLSSLDICILLRRVFFSVSVYDLSVLFWADIFGLKRWYISLPPSIAFLINFYFFSLWPQLNRHFIEYFLLQHLISLSANDHVIFFFFLLFLYFCSHYSFSNDIFSFPFIVSPFWTDKTDVFDWI